MTSCIYHGTHEWVKVKNTTKTTATVVVRRSLFRCECRQEREIISRIRPATVSTSYI